MNDIAQHNMNHGSKTVRTFLIRGTFAAALLALAPGAQADTAETRGGLKIRSDDGAFEFGLNGRIHYDTYSIDADDGATLPGSSPASDAAGGSFFRRTRISLSGKAHGWEYKFEEDFVGAGASGYREMWIGTEVGPGRLHIGQVKPPRGMEELTSANEITLMERPFASSVALFGGGRQHQMGLFYLGNASRFGYGASVYNLAEQTSSAAVTEGVGTTERVYVAPVMGEAVTLHLGASGTVENFHNGRSAVVGSTTGVTYTGRVGPRLVIGASAPDRAATTWQAELGLAAGPITLQSEYARQTLEQAAGAPDQDVTTYYAQAGVFLTGERKPYDVKKGVFRSPKPARALGALELALRYDHIENPDAAAQPEIAQLVAGVNYYVNPNVRFMFDYWMAQAETVAGRDEPNAASLRAQLVF